jgi:DNA repair photolyase
MKTKGNPIGWCDITVNPVTGCPNGCVWNGKMFRRAFNRNIPVFMKDSLSGMMGADFKQEFPEGWKTHKHAETEVHNYAE